MGHATQYPFADGNPRRPSLRTATAALAVAVPAQDLARAPVALVAIAAGAAGSVHSTVLSPDGLSALAHAVAGENPQAWCGGRWFAPGPGYLQVEIRPEGTAQEFPVPAGADWRRPGAAGRTPPASCRP